MKKTHRLALALASVIIAVRAEPPPTGGILANATNRFSITGMHCSGCAHGLTSELTHAKGVTSASVSLTNKLAVVAYDTNRNSVTNLVKVIEAAGFKARKVSH